MNFFILDSDPIKAARLYQDLHVNKIVCEGGQMIATAYPLTRLAEPDCPRTQRGTPRVHSYLKHPMTMWVRENMSNFNWALTHVKALSDEFTYRFDEVHFSTSFIEWCMVNKPLLKEETITLHPQCFSAYPECIVPNDPVAGYQNYYNTAKAMFNFGKRIVKATWTKREVPEFCKPLPPVMQVINTRELILN